MSEDPTQNINQKYDTKPTLETLLARMAAMEERLNARIDGMEERIGVRLDRIEGVAHETKGNFHTLRADFNELRAALREHFPLVK